MVSDLRTDFTPIFWAHTNVYMFRYGLALSFSKSFSLKVREVLAVRHACEMTLRDEHS